MELRREKQIGLLGLCQTSGSYFVSHFEKKERLYRHMSEYLPLQGYEHFKVPRQFKMLHGISLYEPPSRLFYLWQSLLSHNSLLRRTEVCRESGRSHIKQYPM